MNSQKINITAIYHCPHHPLFLKGKNSICNCRKPKNSIFLKAAKENNILLSESIAYSSITTLVAAKYGISRRRRARQITSNTYLLLKMILKKGT